MLAPLTVSQLNKYVKFLLEESDGLRGLAVAGEISNFKAHYSGHWYFTLKDDKAALPAVMFAEANRRLGFVPHNGMHVVVFGRASLYERDGKFQVYAEAMQPDGLGALYLAFEQLKERLAAEDLFDEQHKRPIPVFPKKIGIITSGTGAALQDMLQILRRRCPACEVVLCPVQVQGQGAAQQIAQAVRQFNTRDAADVLIVGRGGGSLEDLWAFNEEAVARAVAASRIPVISAVGHETDVTICDFAADLRAPTPSAAAELAVPDMSEIAAGLQGLQERMAYAVQANLQQRRAALSALLGRRVLTRPQEFIHTAQQRLDDATQRMHSAMTERTLRERAKFTRLAASLHALSPLGVLARGYAIARKNDVPVTSVTQLALWDEIKLQLADGTCNVVVRD